MRRHLAALTAVILPVSACGSLGTAHPALTKIQAEQVLANYQNVNNRANGELDGNLLATVETGAQLEMDRAGYRLRAVKKDKYTPFTYSRPSYYIPRQGGFPKWFAVNATSGNTRHALLFVQDRQGGPWLLTADPFPSAPLIRGQPRQGRLRHGRESARHRRRRPARQGRRSRTPRRCRPARAAWRGALHHRVP